MKYASVCSGIGAPECAWKSLGWQCEFAAEIEPFPSAVHNHHYPTVRNYGDITKFKEWSEQSIDLLVGGTPCQSFSVAGLRGGLADPRGNLMLTFLAIAGRYAPAWVVWENVPGVLSIDEGRAFGTFLGGLAELGYGFAYRVLDAQYFGVAQRRRRVFVVGHSGGQWQRAAAVLFERESMCGNPAPRRETRQRAAPTISAHTKGGGGLGTDADLDGAVIPIQEIGKRQSGTPENGSGYGQEGDPMFTLQRGTQHGIAHSLKADGFDASEDGTGRGTPLIARCVHTNEGTNLDFETSTIMAFSSKDHGADAGELSPTLRACPHDQSHANSGAPPAIAFNSYQRTESEVTSVQRTRSVETGIRQGYAVRRLTPVECERLQGFPDDYTAIEYRGKPACDGPRYKALGNSMAVPVMRWLGRRIESIKPCR